MADSSRKKGRRQKARRRRRIQSTIIGLAAFYVLGIAFFSTHYFPATKVGDINIGFRSRRSAEKYLEKKLGDFTLTVLEEDGNEKIHAKDAGLEYTNLESIRDLLKNQRAMAWGFEITQKHPHNALQVKTDEEKLSKTIDGLKCMAPANPRKSVNAKVVYNKKKKKYVIRKEKIGNIVDKEHFLAGTTESFCNLQSKISLIEDTYYVQPKYTRTSKKVVKAKNLMNDYLKGAVSYRDGDLKISMKKSDVKNFLKCSNKYKVTFKKNTIKKYVQNVVAKKYNSLDGDIPSGLTAWKVSVDNEADNIIKNLKASKKVTRKPVYANEGLDRDEYDLGKTYIDVNISDQCMWYVEGGKVVFSSDVVTGNVSSGHATSTGVYHIAYRQRDHLMVKYNAFVHYWMPYNTTVGVGFHDASWRGAFGGQIYRTDGSHGCINMPPSKAAQLFNMISAGTTVYIHY